MESRELLASHQPCPHRFSAPSKGLSPPNCLLLCSAEHHAPLPCLAFTLEENLWGPHRGKVGGSMRPPPRTEQGAPAQHAGRSPTAAAARWQDGSARCREALFVLRISFINPREASGSLGWERLRWPAASIAIVPGGGKKPPLAPPAAAAPSRPGPLRDVKYSAAAWPWRSRQSRGSCYCRFFFGRRHPLTNF